MSWCFVECAEFNKYCLLFDTDRDTVKDTNGLKSVLQISARIDGYFDCSFRQKLSQTIGELLRKSSALQQCLDHFYTGQIAL